MPNYLFQHPQTQQIKEIYQKMVDPHVYFEGGVEWQRVWQIPQAAVNTKIDPFSKTDFLNKTAGKRGNYGNVQDISKELSLQREKSAGIDPLKENYLDNWQKKRKGILHPDRRKQKARQEAEKLGVVIED